MLKFFSKYFPILFVILILFTVNFSCIRDLDEVEGSGGDGTGGGTMVEPPRQLIVSSARDGGVYLYWLRSIDAVLGYNVYVSTDTVSDNFRKISSLTQTYIYIKHLSYDTIYFFYVKAYKSDAESEPSNLVSAKPINVQAPLPPYGVNVEGINYENKKQITISWYPNTEADFSKYLVFRSDDSTSGVRNYHLQEETSINIYIDSIDLIENKKYYYRIAAVDMGGMTSILSSEEFDYILEKPNLIIPKNYQVISTNNIFRWEKVENALSYTFIITSAKFGNEVYKDVITSNDSIISYSVNLNDLTIGKTYYWKVMTISKFGGEPNSSSEIRAFVYFME